MKLRTHDNSLRLRLERDEVEAIGRGETVESSAPFPGGNALRWRLEVRGDAVSADLDDNCVCIAVPSALARHWALDETEVSIRASVMAGTAVLGILIEKDFECLEPRAGEHQGNRFVNPNKSG